MLEDEKRKIDFIKEWWRYSIFTPSSSYRKYSQFDEQYKFDFLKWLLYNTTTIMIPVWLVTILMPEFVIGQLGIVLGLTVLISPPLLIWFTWIFRVIYRSGYV